MRSHAKATSAGSIHGSGKSRRLAGPLAIFALALCALGGGAPAASADVPTSTMGTATAVAYASAHVTGEVDPKGNLTFYAFEYCKEGSDCAPAGGDWVRGPHAYSEGTPIQPDAGPTAVAENLYGLDAGAKYFIRLGTYEGSAVYNSPQPNPDVTPLPLDPDPPTIVGTVDAEAFSISAKAGGVIGSAPIPGHAFYANCSFEYVTDDQFSANQGGGGSGFEGASSVPCNPNPVTAGPLTSEITGLAPSTTYHLRLNVSNSAGSDTKVASATITTLAPITDPPVVLATDNALASYTTAKVSGEVQRPAGTDPALNANCSFEYVTDDQFSANQGSGGSGFEGASSAPCTPNPVTATGPVSAKLTGLTIATTYHLRLSASNPAGSASKEAVSTFTTLTPDPPVVSIFAPTDVTATSAHFSGEIDPGGTDPVFNAHWHFECTPACPGLEGTMAAVSPDHKVSVDATGLKVNTTYEVSLVASNGGAQAGAGPEQFTTLTLGPVATTIPAFALAGGTRALLGGTVDPENSETDYWFEYGPDESYGSSIPLNQEASAGAAEDPTFVTQELTGLTPSTTYHFHIVASSPAGISEGNDKTFTTPPAGSLGSSIGKGKLPEDRAWEMVSPVDKNSSDVQKGTGYASTSGDAFAFKSQGSFAGQPTAVAAGGTDYLAKRGPAGWMTQGISPSVGNFNLGAGTFGYSADLGISLLSRNDPQNSAGLDPEEPAKTANVTNVNAYLRDNSTGKYKLLNGPYYAAGIDTSNGVLRFFATPDYSHVAFLTSGAVVYEYVAGIGRRLVSVLPGGEPTDGNLWGMSKDGSHIYFEKPPHLFARVDGSTTVQIDKAERTTPSKYEESPIPAPVPSLGSSPNGDKALFFTAKDLVDEDEDVKFDLYLYDQTKPAGERLTLISTGNVPGVAEFRSGYAFAEDLETIYFTTDKQILAGEPAGPGDKAYLWSGGELTYIATLKPGESLQQASRTGRYLTFRSQARVTAYDNAGRPEVYRYDAETGNLVCVSCEPEGNPPVGSGAQFDTESESAGTAKVTFITDQGQVFFQTDESLTPRDSNGQRDVYEYTGGSPRLLSAGTGKAQSWFANATPSGDDVFFGTRDRLVGWDNDNNYDIYDARVNGGLPGPPPPIVGCDGDACQTVPPAPNDPTPSSASFNGPGNLHKKKSKLGTKRHVKKKKKQMKRRHGKQQSKRHG